jgi:hypothetical protein
VGGIGVDRYTSINGGPGDDYSSQTTGSIPFGIGLELRVHWLVASARFNYVYELGTPFNPSDSDPWRYQAQLDPSVLPTAGSETLSSSPPRTGSYA